MKWSQQQNFVVVHFSALLVAGKCSKKVSFQGCDLEIELVEMTLLAPFLC